MLEAAGLATRLSREGRDFFDAALETAPDRQVPIPRSSRRATGASVEPWSETARWPCCRAPCGLRRASA